LFRQEICQSPVPPGFFHALFGAWTAPNPHPAAAAGAGIFFANLTTTAYDDAL
jgi:hypothetical protein